MSDKKIVLNDLKQWDNGIRKWDVTEASRALNPWLASYGEDRYTYDDEPYDLHYRQAKHREATNAHGYPYTSYL